MGQQIPAVLMGSAAEGGGAGRQAHWALGPRGHSLFLTAPHSPPQGLSDLLGFSLLICEIDREVLQCLPAC